MMAKTSPKKRPRKTSKAPQSLSAFIKERKAVAKPLKAQCETPKAPLRSPTRVLFTYPTYNFGGEQDPAINVLHTAIDDAGVNIKELSEKSHVARSTMKNWFSGKTISPKFCTISAVAGALGYEYSLVKRKVIKS